MKNANLFVDEAEIEVHSGAGGDGIVAFRREKYVTNGGPNGGDGGRGGDVIVVATTNVGTLLDLKTANMIKADSGGNGGGNDRKGASGDHKEIPVPVGTLIYAVSRTRRRYVDAEDEFEGQTKELIEETIESEPELIADLTKHGQRVVIAQGGRGGLGNARFKTSTRQAPDFATPGKPAESLRIRLSLKMMADVGLVGFPNAGKSTLLTRISAARPRIANYPFTTLVPKLGVVERDERRCVVADIPGLIEGASEGAGLGHQFLRHVERTRVLIHLLDLEAMMMEGRDLLADYDAIRTELGRYRPELLERREILVLSKADLVHDESLLADLKERLAARGLSPRMISAAATQGLDELLREMFDAVDDERKAAEQEEAESAKTAPSSKAREEGRRR